MWLRVGERWARHSLSLVLNLVLTSVHVWPVLKFKCSDIFLHTHTHTHTYTHTHLCLCNVCMHEHHAHIYMPYTCTHAHMHTCTHAHMYFTCTHVLHMHTCTSHALHMHTCTHVLHLHTANAHCHEGASVSSKKAPHAHTPLCPWHMQRTKATHHHIKGPSFVVTLKPMEIRTFEVQVEYI